jgi:TonB family protein
MRHPAPLLILAVSLIVAGLSQARTLPSGPGLKRQDAAGQRQAPELVEADQLSAQVVDLYQEGKYDQALPLAQRALARRERVLAPEDTAIADALANLAEIYMAKGKRKEAKTHFQRAIAIRDKNPGPDNTGAIKLLERYVCLAAEAGQQDDVSEVRKRLFKLNNGIEYDESSHKAINLPLPAYTLEAKARRISGTVVAKVTVDETGKVSEVKVLCGDPLLVKGIGPAIWNARFKPPTAAGRPVKLIELVTYNFSAK